MTRDEMIAEIRDHESHHGNLTWNVKVRGVNLNFDHLLKRYREDIDDASYTTFPEWIEPCQERYEEVKEDLFSWSIEGAREEVTDCEHDWDAEYEFAGRSGGWLVMTKYDGTKIGTYEDYEFDEWLAEMSDDELTTLHGTVKKHDEWLRPEAIARDVEYRAAWDLFGNVCADVPQPDTTQALLPLD